MPERNPNGKFDDLAKDWKSPETEAVAREFEVSSELVDTFIKLRERGIGRPILWTVANNGSQLVGAILPLNEDETSHLVVFKTQDMLVLEPRLPNDEDSVTEYKNLMANTTDPYEITYSNLPKAIGLMREAQSRIRTVYSNADPAHTKIFDGIIDKAINIGIKMKGEKERVRNESSLNYVDKIKDAIDIYDKNMISKKNIEENPDKN
jgi:hypothetical protein